MFDSGMVIYASGLAATWSHSLACMSAGNIGVETWNRTHGLRWPDLYKITTFYEQRTISRDYGAMLEHGEHGISLRSASEDEWSSAACVFQKSPPA